MAETREQMAARMEKASVAVYLACEKTVADDISAMLRAGAAALRAQGCDEATRCDGRYPVPQTSPPRDEPFDVTYRCALPKGHDGPHGPQQEGV